MSPSEAPQQRRPTAPEAGSTPEGKRSLEFEFLADTFAHGNELVWEYRRDPQTGKMQTRRREPAPQYTLRCFPMARAARQFFLHARFDPTLPKADSTRSRALVRQVLSRPAQARPSQQRITIPGYSNLRQFSQQNEALLKAECGGRWRSYFQRGNWRMVFPFSRRHQAREADRLAASIERGRPAIVHLVRFPELTINHALLLYGVARSDNRVSFAAYDPNDPLRPAELHYDCGRRTFHFPANAYFGGGRVDVYEIDRNLCF